MQVIEMMPGMSQIMAAGGGAADATARVQAVCSGEGCAFQRVSHSMFLQSRMTGNYEFHEPKGATVLLRCGISVGH